MGKKDKVQAYKEFIEKNKLDDNNGTPQQKLAKDIMVHKLKSEMETVKNITAKQSHWQADPNPELDKEIDTVIENLILRDKDTINEDLKKYFTQGVTIDSISSKDMELLMNWVA